MPIERSTLEHCRYYPELLPSAEYVSPGAGTEEDVLNITRIPNGLLTRLSDVGAVRSSDAELRFKADSETFQVPAASLLNLSEPNEYNLLATRSVRLSVYANSDLSNYQIWHGLWCKDITVAEKLAYGISLTREEQAINDELGVSKTVERGTLPPAINRMLLYEYEPPIYRETRTIRKDVSTSGIEVDTIRPRKTGEQFVVLEGISAERPSSAGNNVRITVARDDDGSRSSPFLSLSAWAMDLDYSIPMWIPATREISIWCETGTSLSSYRIRYVYGVYRLTSIIKARWGIGEFSEELRRKAKAGIV